MAASGKSSRENDAPLPSICKTFRRLCTGAARLTLPNKDSEVLGVDASIETCCVTGLMTTFNLLSLPAAALPAKARIQLIFTLDRITTMRGSYHHQAWWLLTPKVPGLMLAKCFARNA